MLRQEREVSRDALGHDRAGLEDTRGQGCSVPCVVQPSVPHALQRRPGRGKPRPKDGLIQGRLDFEVGWAAKEEPWRMRYKRSAPA